MSMKHFVLFVFKERELRETTPFISPSTSDWRAKLKEALASEANDQVYLVGCNYTPALIIHVLEKSRAIPNSHKLRSHLKSAAIVTNSSITSGKGELLH